ncbi:hypothetical protein QTH97_30775 [Variovorax sp. J22R24]|uniref:hypothetical protein n=1 Tax=Variovorax gracilis TaxID=3053502 RepID=UPI002576A320|nr:hypothetical protein [Variovorax sp. J22R24]MDM0109348.1 hypothetical protein [Variovorax sp. J22R24]
MELYAAIDLHSKNSVSMVIDAQGRTILAQRLSTDLDVIVAARSILLGYVAWPW